MGSMTSTTCFEREVELREHLNGKRLTAAEIADLVDTRTADMKAAAERLKARPDGDVAPKGEARLLPATLHGSTV